MQSTDTASLIFAFYANMAALMNYLNSCLPAPLMSIFTNSENHGHGTRKCKDPKTVKYNYDI